ncbi:hypothetical protein D3C86_909730 [compost metagenome]
MRALRILRHSAGVGINKGASKPMVSAIIGGIVVGVILGIIGTNIWNSMPTRQVAAPRYYRRRETGDRYREVGRAYLVGAFGESSDLWLMAPIGKSGQEAWPEERVRKEFDQIAFDDL